ncbi:MAG: CIA30 family protein [Longimicrobiales bacterium]
MSTRLGVATLTLMLSCMSLAAQEESGMVKLVDFDEVSPEPWFVVNDGVMGGRSTSTLRLSAPGVAVFEGTLSLENNGGFASVRAGLSAAALAGATRILLRVRGDGKRYQLRLRPGRRMDGIAFGRSFETIAGQWTIVELAIESFEPTFRGYRPRSVPPLDPADAGQVGLMLTDKQEGDFRLEIDWIGFCRHDGPCASPPIG